MPAACTLQQHRAHRPGFVMPASRTTKTLRPAELTQILPTGLLASETRLELGQIPGIIFHRPRSYILGSPESSKYPSTLESQTGIFLSLSDEGIFFRVGQEGRSVTRQNLLRLTVIDRPSRKRNIVLGLAIGTAAGLAGGGALAAAAGWFDEGTGSKPLVTIVGFGVGGAVAGYAMGASSGTRTIYRKKRSKCQLKSSSAAARKHLSTRLRAYWAAKRKAGKK